MDSVRSVQTAFRFRPELLERLKRRAHFEGKSLNQYVEGILEKSLMSKEIRYKEACEALAELEVPKTIPPELMALSRFKVCFTEEEIEDDPRLETILNR